MNSVKFFSGSLWGFRGIPFEGSFKGFLKGSVKVSRRVLKRFRIQGT